MKKIYAVATESDVVLAFESRSDADEYAGAVKPEGRE